MRRRLTAARELPEARRQQELVDVIADHIPFARRLGRRFAPTPSLVDDCEQVACVGLVLAVQRWDPAFDASLSSYAQPTILGELRRFLRDTTWWVRPPRRLQELAAQVRAMEEELRHAHGDHPSLADLARALDRPVEEVREARMAAAGRHVVSVDDEDSGTSGLLHTAPSGAVDEWVSLHPHIRALDPRDRCVLLRRYLEDETQDSIAKSLGISQAQVSRRLKRAVSTLREQVTGGTQK
ncbi:sigma-70 family RNA polymerase sigma factor [Kytococcus sedentarius]|uniref:sigma-70 family RNA polymerase sigma factor n=1 Tax=Kytococcus sedentarius TaxID=1276 RepID=UPI0035BC76A1